MVRIIGPSNTFILKSLKQGIRLSSYGFTDSIGSPTDAINSLVFGKNIFDNVTVSDSINTSGTLAQILQDSSTILDLIGVDDGITYGLHKYFYDEILVLDSFGYLRGLPTSDSIGITESHVLGFGKFLSESLLSTELAKLSISLVKTDSAIVSELISLNPGKVFSDSIESPTDAINSLVFGKNIFDNATAEDLVLVPDGLTYTFAKTLSEILSATEVFQKEVSFSRTFADSSTASESVFLSAEFNRTFTDSTSATESVVVSQGWVRFFSDSISIVDSQDFISGAGLRFDSDFVLAVDSDGILISQGWGRPSGDSAAATEVISLVAVFNRLFADSSTANESISLGLSRILSDSSSANESISLGPNKILFDSISSPTDLINTFAFGKYLNDSSVITETSVYTFGMFKNNEILSPIDTPVFNVGLKLSDSSSITQIISLQSSLLKSDSANTTDAGIISVQNYFAEEYVTFSGRYVETSNTIF